MIGWLGEWYLWLKALHIMAVMAWMAGLLYLPRLFVYHAEAAPGSDAAKTFEVMERRLLRAIMNPAMIVVWIVGLMLFAHIGGWTQGWMHAKLLLVVILTVLHHLYALWRKDLAAGRNKHTPRFYRILNEMPALLMVGIVLLAVVKPF